MKLHGYLLSNEVTINSFSTIFNLVELLHKLGLKSQLENPK